MEESNDFKLPFRSMRGELAAADVTFGNLEGPFCPKAPFTESGITFRVNPKGIDGLEWAGFDVLSVANNHFSDGGAECMEFTRTELKKSNIEAVGAGMSFEEAHRAAIIERKGIRLAFQAYSYAARNDRPGDKKPVIAGRNIEHARKDIATALKSADVVLVSLHDGAEYTSRIAAETRAFCRAVIDAGATAVLGHHPHVPQEIEQYGEGWIFYSLGNFVFWQNHPPETRTGLAARLTFSGRKLEKVEALPVVIESVSRPRLADPSESDRILSRAGIRSSVIWRRGADVARLPSSNAPERPAAHSR
jgi:poly-gamma-glutamate synthesis protein (capsule biosynthesis protein)